MRNGGRQPGQISQTSSSRVSSGTSYAAAAYQSHTPPVSGKDFLPRPLAFGGSRQEGRNPNYQGYPQANHATGGYDMVDNRFQHQVPPNSRGAGRGRGFRAAMGDSKVMSSNVVIRGKPRNGNGHKGVGGASAQRDM